MLDGIDTASMRGASGSLVDLADSPSRVLRRPTFSVIEDLHGYVILNNALWRNPEDLTRRQEAKLAWIAQVNTRLYRAYLMKEQLRIAIRTKGVLALTMLDEWLAWGQRCRIDAFVELGRKIKKNIAGIEAAMLNNLSNALIESTNTKLRVLHRMAFGFRQPEHLIALALLDRGGYCPPLPGRDHSSAPALAALG